MRRAGGLWPAVVDFEHLCVSARRASLGKRGSAALVAAERWCRVLGHGRDLKGALWNSTWNFHGFKDLESRCPQDRFTAKSGINNKLEMVGARGVEPPTSAPQMQRATRLRHAPTGGRENRTPRGPWLAGFGMNADCFGIGGMSGLPGGWLAHSNSDFSLARPVSNIAPIEPATMSVMYPESTGGMESSMSPSMVQTTVVFSPSTS
jgi:hypothetical protein